MGMMRVGPKHLVGSMKVELPIQLQPDLDMISDIVSAERLASSDLISELQGKIAEMQTTLNLKPLEILRDVPKEVKVIEEKIIIQDKIVDRIVEVIKEVEVSVEKIVEVIKHVPQEVRVIEEKIVNVIPKWVMGIIGIETAIIVLLLLK